MIEFGESLVYDGRTEICYAFDPRDEKKRRLQLVEENCMEYNCFDCGFTAGKCDWDRNFGMCLNPSRLKD